MKYCDLFSCKNKVALVTGGCGLLGNEICKSLSAFGAKVYVADINENEIFVVTKDTEMSPVCLDITSEESILDTIDSIIKESGRLDILVNCAYPRTQDWGDRFEDVTFSSWQKNLTDHLGGFFLCSKKAAEQMKKQRKGSIINIASIYGIVAPDFSIYEGTEMTMPVAYSSIKGGIISLTKYIATYFGNENIRANVISPGGIYDNQDPSFVEKYSKKTPLGRMGKPDEIVGAVVYLASDASSFVTGQNIVVDGGWTAW